MITHEGIDKNFRFLVLEVRRQTESLARLIPAPSDSKLSAVLFRDNYTDTLKALIEKKCISFFRHSPTIDKTSAAMVSAISVSTTNLERIADFCVNVAGEIKALQKPQTINQFHFGESINLLSETLERVPGAMEKTDAAAALQICDVEQRLDEIYKRDYYAIREALRTGDQTDDLLHCLYIAHYLERMGDAMLNIGEAILFAATGERLKLQEYKRLRAALNTQHPGAAVSDFSINFQWETRSGCRIAHVSDRGGDTPELDAIFKDGHADKLRKEHENIQRWAGVMPGLPPRVLDFREGGKDAALLLEYLDGYTLRDLVLSGDSPILQQALSAVESVLRTIWLATKQEESINARFSAQMADRIDEIFRLHPEFRNACYEVGTMSCPSLEELLRVGQEIEEKIPAPFCVLTHGDLNTDNIIYNHRINRVHFIDLYRSKHSDYVQDVSILLTSNFRLPVLEGEVRENVNQVVSRLLAFAESFARDQNDETFNLRLSLGLARGLITSTRFESDVQFAKAMYTRAVYLLERIVEWDKNPSTATGISPDVLVY